MVQDFVKLKILVSCQCFELLLLLSPVAMELCRDGEITDIMEIQGHVEVGASRYKTPEQADVQKGNSYIYEENPNNSQEVGDTSPPCNESDISRFIS